jgi:hypothetical protein
LYSGKAGIEEKTVLHHMDQYELAKKEYRKAKLKFQEADEQLMQQIPEAQHGQSMYRPLVDAADRSTIDKMIDLEKDLKKFNKTRKFFAVLSDTKLNNNIEYLNELQKKYTIRFCCKGGFSLFFGIFRYHPSETMIDHIPIHDIDAATYSSDVNTLSDHLIKEEGFTFVRQQNNRKGKVIYININKVMNGIPIDLTLIQVSYSNNQCYIEYKGNEFIASLASGETYLYDRYSDDQGIDFIEINNRGYRIGIRKNNYFQEACAGQESYALYDPSRHKKYCVMLLKNHLKSLKLGVCKKASKGLVSYQDTLLHLENTFLKLLLLSSNHPHLEIYELLKYIKKAETQEPDAKAQLFLNAQSEPLLEAYFHAAFRAECQKANLIADPKALALMTEDIILFFKKHYIITNHLDLSDFQIQMILTNIIDSIFQCKLKHGFEQSIFSDALSPLCEQWKEGLSKIVKPAPSDVKQLPSSFLRQLSIYIPPVSPTSLPSSGVSSSLVRSSSSNVSSIVTPSSEEEPFSAASIASMR